MKRLKISVAMATYNGELYLKEQLNSILACLIDQDEIIISDDGSTDGTVDILKSYMNNDSRIHLLSGPGKGIKQNFGNAIKYCSGDIIFLSDQDDVWDKRKTEIVLNVFNDPDCMAVNHNAAITDSEGNDTGMTLFEFRNSRPGIIRNVWKNSYVGCCMAFRRELVPYVLPIPDDIEMHDQWIGLIAEKKGRSIFLDRSLTHYRRHSQNASEMHHHPVPVMITRRIHLIRQFMHRIRAWKKSGV